jgi:hypothetical protein
VEVRAAYKKEQSTQANSGTGTRAPGPEGCEVVQARGGECLAVELVAKGARVLHQAQANDEASLR